MENQFNKKIDDLKLRIKEDNKRYQKEVRQEEERISKLKCPQCHSREKRHFLLTDSNGILGPGNFSRVQLEFYICGVCGIHFSDLHKKDIKPPMSDNDIFLTTSIL